MSPDLDRPERLRDVNWFLHVPRHWLETRLARRLQRRRARILLLVATVVLAGLYAAALALDDPGGTFFGALVLFVVVSALAMLAGGPTVCAPPDRLDERELAQRGQVMGIAFAATAVVFLVVIALTAVLARPVVAGSAQTVDASRLPTLLMAPLLFGLLVHSVVPIAVLTWLERDRYPDPVTPGDAGSRSGDPDAPLPGPEPSDAGLGPLGPRRVPADDPAARRALADARPGAAQTTGARGATTDARPAAAAEDATAAVSPDGVGLPVTHDFPVVDPQRDEG